MYLLDTDHCARIIGGDDVLLEEIAAMGEMQVATCVAVRGELIYMAQNSEQQAHNLARVREFLEDIRVYYVDEEAADVYGQFKADLLRHYGPKEKNKRRRTRLQDLGVGENDLWITSIAIRNGLTVVSADSDFRRMKEARDFPLEAW